MDPNNPADNSNGSDQLLINKALEIIGGKWRLSIILLLSEHTFRYTELRNKLPTVSEKVLADELKTLLLLGVLSRKAYPEVPPRVEYALTESGLRALPLLIHLKEIGRIFLSSLGQNNQ